ncbi:protein FAM149B1-like isoform X2 [Amphiura filiformis]|uniref:protein FAM149B1-like isoform X2 n=1 Tax=Amphiura filiformis TaxID=82378 RepID=UPI003B21CB36
MVIMAGKKPRNRNILSMDKMEIRRISSRTDNYPLPERPEDVLPQHYLESVKEALSSYVTPSASGTSSPSEETETPNALVLSNSHGHSGWTTGNSTERSSLFSWADDEFDKQAAQTVQKMFDEIDDMLFEEQKNAMTSLQLQNECKEWNARFPHIRILGRQLLKPGDEGYQYYPGNRPATAGELLDIADHEVPGNTSPIPQGLSISGKHLDTLKVPASELASNRGDSPSEQTLAYLEEEIIESDGFIEEYLAYDHYQDDEEHERKKYHAPRRRQGFPPVTPNACMQNTVLSQTFDVLWAEVVVWMRHIVRKHSDLLLEEKRLGNPDDEASQMSVLRPVGAPFDLSYSPTSFGQSTARSMDMQGSKLAPMGSSMKFGTGPPFNFGIQPEQRGSLNGLNGLITISSKALHNRPSERAPSALGGEDASMFGLNTARPGSSTIAPRTNRPGSVRMSEFSYNNYRQPSARGGRKGQLKPLDNRSKTPQLKEGMITGKRIGTANDRLGSPPHPAASPTNNHHWSRNATLPPIEVSSQENSNQFPMRPLKSQNKFRISSAVVDDRGLRPRNNALYNAFAVDSRPNTTHTFRDDMPTFGGRRSSTPQAFSMLKPPGSANTMHKPPGSATGNRSNNVPGGITGVSLGIPGSQSQLDTGSVGPYAGGPQPNYFRVL